MFSARAGNWNITAANTRTWVGRSGRNNQSTIILEEVVLKLLTPLGALGILWNVLVIVTLFSRRVVHTTSSRFVMALAATDISVCTIFIVPALQIMSTGTLQVSWTTCLMYMYVFVLFTAFSIYTITVISIDRYFGVTFPLRRNALMSKKGVRMAMVAVAAVSFLITVPVLLQTFRSGLETPSLIRHRQAHAYVNMLLCHMVTPGIWYICVMDLLLFLLPLLVMIESYRRVSRKVKNGSNKTGITVMPIEGRGNSSISDGDMLRIHHGKGDRRLSRKYWHPMGPTGSIMRKGSARVLPKAGNRTTPPAHVTLSVAVQELSASESECCSSPAGFDSRSSNYPWPRRKSRSSTTTDVDTSYTISTQLDQYSTMSSYPLSSSCRPMPSAVHDATTTKPHLSTLSSDRAVSFRQISPSSGTTIEKSSSLNTDARDTLNSDENTLSKDRLISFLNNLPQSLPPPHPLPTHGQRRKSRTWPFDVHSAGGSAGRGSVGKRNGRRSQSFSPPRDESAKIGEFAESSGRSCQNYLCTCCRHELFCKTNKASVTLTVLLVLFVLFWMPYFVMLPVCFIRGNEDATDHFDFCAYSSWLGLSHSLVNPFIYAWARPDYRSAFSSIIRCKPHKPAPVSPISWTNPRLQWSYTIESMSTMRSSH